jgi:Saxitoxin biosynthesis operon protein SxtJ
VMIRINTNLPTGQLRLFGGLLAVLLALVGWLVLDRTGPVAAVVLLWCCAALSAGVAGFTPGRLRPVYIGLSYLMLPVGILISFLILALIFFFLLTPTALILKLCGRDALTRKFEPDKHSYWRRRHFKKDMKRYFQQY